MPTFSTSSTSSTSSSPKTLLIMAGGTGGHVFPALAIAHQLKAEGHNVVWLGAPDSFESRKVPENGFAIETIAVSGLRGKGVVKLLSAPFLLLKAVWQARSVLKKIQPQVVLGMGGFAAGPGGVAAKWLGIPLVIHEQNAAAGLTNRALAKIATRTLQAFPNTFKNAETVGNPVRAGFAELPSPSERLHQHSGALRVLVIGGSQGAKALNEKVPAALAVLQQQGLAMPEVWHQAGRTLDVAETAYRQHGISAKLEAFITDMPAAYAWADVVLCRSGASTIAELAASGCASLLVPFPFAVDDHQSANAHYLVQGGAAWCIQEKDLSPETLAARLHGCNRPELIRMAEAARRLAWVDAVPRTVAVLLKESL
jgi:UDP-N-acetylglucosamine--N-acetylmuramyl-(pentapeptide) pyrophosphoryl-undecaprenol N-acetylglucosamine transferase